MPELPEVQTTVTGIQNHVAGLTITDVWTDYKSSFHSNKDNIKDPKYFAKFRALVVGTKITGASRRAKNILIHLSNDYTILIHMKMTGHMMVGRYVFDPKGHASFHREKWAPDENKKSNNYDNLVDPFNRFLHLVFTLSDGTGKDGAAKNSAPHTNLVLSDMRKFGKVTLIKNEDIHNGNTSHLAGIGPEPLESTFTLNIFKEQISRRPTGRIKNVLMDQSLIAGIGNIYSDEVLWRAGVHPEEPVKNIPEEKLKIMFRAIKETLAKGIDFGGDSMSDYRNIQGERGKFQEHHEAYRRTKLKCNKRGCPGIILRKMVGGRSAHFCSVHQQLESPQKQKSRTKISKKSDGQNQK